MSAARSPYRSIDRTLLIVCLVVLGGVVAYPTARLVVGAVLNWEWQAIAEGAGLDAVRNTLLIGFGSVATSGLVGTALAFLVTRYTFPGRRPLAALAYLPFALPPLVGTLSFYYLIGADGFVPRLIESITGGPEPSLSGPAAILVIHTYSFYVFFYAMVSASLEGMDVSQIEAARTLGASRQRVFWRVMLPMLAPALLGASLLTFMTSGASFSAPLFFGDDFPYLSVQIFRERSSFNESRALTLTVVLACVSLLGVGLFRSRRKPGGVASKGAPRAVKSRPGRIAAAVAAWSFMGIVLTPHAVIVWLSFVKHSAWAAEIVPRSYTLDNYAALFGDMSAFRPIQNSFWMSLLAALGTLALGTQAAYLIGRQRRGSVWIGVLVMIPWALPGTVIAMNLITAFNDRWLPDWLAIYNTVWILPLAYFVRNLPLLTRMVSAPVAQFDGSLIEAGRTLGASQAYCARHIVAPILAPVLLASTALVFATCLGEFVASILLYTPNNVPIAVQVFTQWRGSGIGSAFAYSVFLMILVTATFLLSRRFASRIV